MSCCRYLGIIVMLSLTACSGIPFTGIPLLHHVDDAQIDQWITQQQYSNAISALEYQLDAQAEKNHQQKLLQIKKLANEYDHTQASSVLTLQRQNNWHEAFKVLNKSLQNYPDGIQLQQVRKRLLQQQYNLRGQLQAQSLLARAEWLARNHDIQRELAHIDHDDVSAKIHLQQIRQQLSDISTELYDHGMAVKANNDLDLAERCFIMSNRIKPQTKTEKAINAVIHLKKMDRQQQLIKQNENLLTEIQQAQTNADLARVGKLLQQADKIPEGSDADPVLIKLDQALKDAIAEKLEMLTKQGDNLYSSEKIEQAIKIWSAALALDPENHTIQERIQRAERVLEKFEQLKKQKNPSR